MTLADEARLGKRLRQARRPSDFGAVERQIERSELLVADRRAALPTITYPDLPVSAKRDDLAAAIRDHQVVVVAGETGSGKTTQLPKICLELGRGVRGTIGHTQPRRLAARTVAQRIADELHSPLGDVVGYTVRFTDQVSDRTLVKVMTDGILLAEIQRDRMLRRYDTLIVDEAHERSLNIDFLIGYLTRLLPQRPDLKLIVTSATIDPQRFSAHFATQRTTDAATTRRSSRSAAAPTRSRSGTGRSSPSSPTATTTIRTIPITTWCTAYGRATRPKRSSTRCANSTASSPATSSCSCRANARSATPPTRCARRSCATRTCCRSMHGCPPPSSRRCSSRTPVGASCWRPTSRRRR